MFDIHLSWSPIFLLGMLLLLVVGVIVSRRFLNLKERIWCFLVLLAIILYAAFDVGTRQENLGRENFNQDFSKQEFKKQENSRPNAQTTRENFDAKLIVDPVQKPAPVAHPQGEKQ